MVLDVMIDHLRAEKMKVKHQSVFFGTPCILQGHIFCFTFQLLSCYCFSFDELYLKAIAPTPKKYRHILEDSMHY